MNRRGVCGKMVLTGIVWLFSAGFCPPSAQTVVELYGPITCGVGSDCIAPPAVNDNGDLLFTINPDPMDTRWAGSLLHVDGAGVVNTVALSAAPGSPECTLPAAFCLGEIGLRGPLLNNSGGFAVQAGARIVGIDGAALPLDLLRPTPIQDPMLGYYTVPDEALDSGFLDPSGDVGVTLTGVCPGGTTRNDIMLGDGSLIDLLPPGVPLFESCLDHAIVYARNSPSGNHLVWGIEDAISGETELFASLGGAAAISVVPGADVTAAAINDSGIVAYVERIVALDEVRRVYRIDAGNRGTAQLLDEAINGVDTFNYISDIAINNSGDIAYHLFTYIVGFDAEHDMKVVGGGSNTPQILLAEDASFAGGVIRNMKWRNSGLNANGHIYLAVELDSGDFHIARITQGPPSEVGFALGRAFPLDDGNYHIYGLEGQVAQVPMQLNNPPVSALSVGFVLDFDGETLNDTVEFSAGGGMIATTSFTAPDLPPDPDPNVVDSDDLFVGSLAFDGVPPELTAVAPTTVGYAVVRELFAAGRGGIGVGVECIYVYACLVFNRHCDKIDESAPRGSSPQLDAFVAGADLLRAFRDQELSTSISGNYYTNRYYQFGSEFAAATFRDPTLVYDVVIGANQWQPAFDSLVNGDGSFLITQDLVNIGNEILDGWIDNGSPALAELVATERARLDFHNAAGLTMAQFQAVMEAADTETVFAASFE